MERQGRASVRLVVKHDSIYVSAQCDSLERLVEELSVTARHARTTSDSLSRLVKSREETTRASPRPLTSLVPWWVWLTLGLWLRHRFGDYSKGLIRAFKHIKNRITTILKNK